MRSWADGRQGWARVRPARLGGVQPGRRTASAPFMFMISAGPAVDMLGLLVTFSPVWCTVVPPCTRPCGGLSDGPSRSTPGRRHAGHAGHGCARGHLGGDRVDVAEDQAGHDATTPELRARLAQGAVENGDRQVTGWGSTAGTMAKARRTTSGLEFGSVPDPVKIPPRPWPVTQKHVDGRAPAARNGVASRPPAGRPDDEQSDGQQPRGPARRWRRGCRSW